MKKKIIIISIFAVSLLVISIVCSYLITKNSGKNKKVVEELPVNQSVDTKKTEDTNINNDAYKEINIESQLANEIFKFVPKYLENISNKMSNEYMIYAAISRLEEQQTETGTYLINEEQIQGYKFDLVQNAARKIYGNTVKIEKKETYNLPFGYNTESNVFYKYAMGFGSTEESLIIKELKENDKTYKLTAYAVSIEYDINDLTHIYISTKDTYKLYNNNNEMNQDIIRKSQKEFTLNGIQIDTTAIVNEYKKDLPLIEYELEKLDIRGTEYFVKNVKFIFD